MQAAPLVAPEPSSFVEWAVRARPLDGESECGDAHAVVPFAQGVLIAAIDGLGHGAEAAVAARRAVEFLRNHSDGPVAELIRKCHAALYHTRGVVMSMASLAVADSSVTWIGVGNVEGMLFRADASRDPPRLSLALRSGVLGYQIPSLRSSTFPIFRGDTLIFVTDGIDSGFSQDLPLHERPDAIAADILSRHAKETDDALCLVIRYLGVPI